MKRRTCWMSSFIVTAALLCVSPPLQAQQPSAAAVSVEEESARVRWDPRWDKMRWWEYAGSSALMAGGFAARFLGPDPPQTFKGGVWFDAELSDALAIENRQTFDLVFDASNITYVLAMGYRAFDAIVVAGIIHGSWDVAWQMAWIDFETLSLLASTLWIGQMFVGRQRPGVSRCGEADGIGIACSPDSSERNRSLFAGHPATVLIAAGATCLHHGHMPLYGGGFAGDLACGTMIGLSVANAFGRLATGSHYPSDALLGLGFGAAVGWLVPKALHYGFGDSRQRIDVTIGPSWHDRGRGIVVRARF